MSEQTPESYWELWDLVSRNLLATSPSLEVLIDDMFGLNPDQETIDSLNDYAVCYVGQYGKVNIALLLDNIVTHEKAEEE